jgi:hypothetical protein
VALFGSRKKNRGPAICGEAAEAEIQAEQHEFEYTKHSVGKNGQTWAQPSLSP